MRYMSLNRDEEIILSILRTYTGIYDMQTAFKSTISEKSKHTENQVLLSYIN
jgi:ATP-dependent DNA helicase RecQ